MRQKKSSAEGGVVPAQTKVKLKGALSVLTYRSAQEKKFFFFAFSRGIPLAEINFFAEKNKNELFRQGFSPQNFVEGFLCKSFV